MPKRLVFFINQVGLKDDEKAAEYYKDALKLCNESGDKHAGLWIEKSLERLHPPLPRPIQTPE